MIWVFYILLFWFLGPPLLVTFGLLFKQNRGLRHFSDGTTTIQYVLPSWLRWLSNQIDGLTGDDRGWYWNTYFPSWVPDWFKMMWWSGVRNPWNYLKRYVIGIDIRNYTFHKLCGDDYVEDEIGKEGFQILYAKPKLSNRSDDRLYHFYKCRPMLYWVRRWGKSNRGIVMQLAWKIKLDHNGKTYPSSVKYWKGITFEVNPIKDIT